MKNFKIYYILCVCKIRLIKFVFVFISVWYDMLFWFLCIVLCFLNIEGNKLFLVWFVFFNVYVDIKCDLYGFELI